MMICNGQNETRRASAGWRALCGLLALAFLAACQSGSVVKNEAAAGGDKKKEVVQVGDFDVPIIDGKTTKLSEITSRNKVVVFDFWATWCGPCRMEIPHLIELHKDYKDKGVDVIGLTTEDPQADADKVRDFMKEMKISYEVGFASNRMFMTMTRNSGSIPQTMVFDRNGKLVSWIRGFTPDIGNRLRAAVDKALQQS
ncbi:MAG: TlpA family protein disulfide reductase [Blastocatellia bacterium]